MYIASACSHSVFQKMYKLEIRMQIVNKFYIFFIIVPFICLIDKTYAN